MQKSRNLRTDHIDQGGGRSPVSGFASRARKRGTWERGGGARGGPRAAVLHIWTAVAVAVEGGRRSGAVVRGLE